VDTYQITYAGKTSFSQQQPTTNNNEETLLMEYVETGTNETFKDSLLIAESYNQGKGVVSFTQDALNTLEEQGLILEQRNEETLRINCENEKKTARLLSYVITSGFIAEVPKLYVTHLFIEKNSATILMFSHTTEKSSEQKAIRDAFNSVICKE
jgi:hypothetical protein